TDGCFQQYVFFFFFQAEDGIRDFHVTGVQTCALPILFGLAVPEQAVIIPRYQLFAALDLHNTYVGLMLPGMSGPFGVFLMTQYFKAIPKEIDEAAELDGASRFRTFWRVLLPMTLPAQ